MPERTPARGPFLDSAFSSPLHGVSSCMDLIERLFHVSPDGGSGTLEMTLLLIALTALLGLHARRRLRVRPANSSL